MAGYFYAGIFQIVLSSTIIDTWLEYVSRAYPEVPQEDIRATALENFAMVALTADHGIEDGILERAARGEQNNPADFYYDPDEYGPVMMALARHLGVEKGSACAELVFKPEHRRRLSTESF